MRGSIKKRYEGSWSRFSIPAIRLIPMKPPKATAEGRHFPRNKEGRAESSDRAALSGQPRRARRVITADARRLADRMARQGDQASGPAPARHVCQHTSTSSKSRLIPALGAIRLQELKAADLKRYYTEADDFIVHAGAASRYLSLGR